MEKPYLLHMITPEKNISPFDANMAFDAGWDSIIPYTNVTMEEIQALVQDTIFSRSPSKINPGILQSLLFPVHKYQRK